MPWKLCAVTALTALMSLSVQAGELRNIVLTPIGQYDSGIRDDGSTEIAAYDSSSARVFVVNASQQTVDVLDLSQPWAPRKVFSIDITPWGKAANSVAIRDGVVAVAIEAENKQAPGQVAFFHREGSLINAVQVGALPDMLTFTPDGTKVLVANEGEPLDYCQQGVEFDPEGSISIIDLTPGVANLTAANVRSAGFSAFNGAPPQGLRVFGPGATVAQDLEPEYIAVSSDSTTAWVVLQENNAVAVLDIQQAAVTAILPLGSKDHSRPWNALDASNRDDAMRIVPWPVRGLYQPDSIVSYRAGGNTYLITANEGDARDYDCFSEEARVGDLPLDPAVFPDAARLQEDAELGRLNSTTVNGDGNGDGLHEEIYSYGARSFTIWDTQGRLVWDSGKDFETLTAGNLPLEFNSQGATTDSFDARSDDKGPEPEGLALGRFRDRWFAFIGLERRGGIMVYDVTEPARPYFVQYVDNFDSTGSPKVGTVPDQGPEGLLFISRGDSPIGRALLVVSNEVSGTVTVYSIKPRFVD